MGTFADAKLEIGTTAIVDRSAADGGLADFEADIYIEIEGLHDMGDLGAEANVINFELVTDKWSKKSKGLRNAGDPAVVVERRAGAPGQTAMRAAEQTKFFYNFRLTLADAESATVTNTVYYFSALVIGANNQFGGVEDFVTETYVLGIYPGPLIIDGGQPIP